MTAIALVRPLREGAAADENTAPPTLRQATLLARLLGEQLLANVQRTAALNFAAADALLAHARIPKPPSFERRCEDWRWAWRSFEICATSADQMLNLSRGHLERNTDELWHLAERLLNDLGAAPAMQMNLLRSSFDALRETQAQYWRAAQQAHEDLVALASEPTRGPAREPQPGEAPPQRLPMPLPPMPLPSIHPTPRNGSPQHG